MPRRGFERRSAWIATVTLGMLAVLGLQWVAVSGQSLVGDAPYHLLAGHQALRYGENRLNLEHPPLVKMVAALPLLAEEPLAPEMSVDRVLEESRRIFDDPERLHRVRIRSRLLLLAVFGLPLLGAAFLLGRAAVGSEHGVRTGTVLALAVGLSFSVVPYLPIVQTDAAAALGLNLVAWAALAYLAAPGWRWALVLGMALGLAGAAKFSGVLAAPAIAVAVALGRGRSRGRRLGDLALVGAVAVVVVGVTYGVANRNYDLATGRATISSYCRGEALIVDETMRRFEEPLLAVEEVSPSLAQWLTGFLGIRLQNEIGVYPTYAFGELRSEGRWWYFPAVLATRTPVVLLLAIFAGLFTACRGGGTPFRRHAWVLATMVAVYLGVAMTSNYNLGPRHLLPIVPLLYLPAARWAAARRVRAAGLVAILALEAAVLAPLWMSATNTWWLGRYNPTARAFSLGDADYRQNFLALADAARERGIESLRVVDPLLRPRELAAQVPGAVLVEPGDLGADGRLEPGWYAVSTLFGQYRPALARARREDVRGYDGLVAQAETWEPVVLAARRGQDHGEIAGTFDLYRIPD